MALWRKVCNKSSKRLDEKVGKKRGKELCQESRKEIETMYATKGE